MPELRLRIETDPDQAVARLKLARAHGGYLANREIHLPRGPAKRRRPPRVAADTVIGYNRGGQTKIDIRRTIGAAYE
jgi:hypothetical protein